MRRDEFGDKKPGVLVTTTFHERDPTKPGKLRAAKGDAFVPNPLPPEINRGELLVATIEELQNAERALGLLEGAASRLENSHLLSGAFKFREARLSSAIEDTFASAAEMAMFSQNPTAVPGGSSADIREVVNYVHALDHGLARAVERDHPVSLNILKEMHGILLGGVERKAGVPGRFRITQNAIGRNDLPFSEARFVPPPPGELEGLLRNLEKYINQPGDDLPRLVRLALVHYQFECIHPFDDGNGRIGRLLIALQLCAQAHLSKPLVYVSGYLESHRESYVELLRRVSLHGEWIQWIKFFLSAVASEAAQSHARADQLLTLRDQFRERVHARGGSATDLKVIDHLFLVPSTTIGRVAETVERTHTAATSLLARLERDGVVKEVTGRRKGKVYVVPAILEIIDS